MDAYFVHAFGAFVVKDPNNPSVGCLKIWKSRVVPGRPFGQPLQPKLTARMRVSGTPRRFEDQPLGCQPIERNRGGVRDLIERRKKPASSRLMKRWKTNDA
jgi:hypothetical protein